MEYDVIVIGSGPAGEKGAAQAAYFGKKVALIEKEKAYGGAAANTGTLPSKTLRETALQLSGFRKRELYGLDFNFSQRMDAASFLNHFKTVRSMERDRIANNLERHHIDQYLGTATLLDPNTVQVQSADGTVQTLHAAKILIATGVVTREMPGFPFNGKSVIGSRQAMALENQPKEIIIIGAGADCQIVGSGGGGTFGAHFY